MVFVVVLSICMLKLLWPIFTAKELIITYGIKPFDICQKNIKLWNLIKILYIITFLFSNLIYSYFVFNKIKNNEKIEPKKEMMEKDKLKNNLKLLIGYDIKTKEKIYLPEYGLYQNFLITGTIGTGKTSSAMYPFTRTTYTIQF